ncbi:Mechanosensory protein 2, partial [Fasciola gigantica]
VERVEIKDVRLPIQLQRAMAAEAEAAREARAKCSQLKELDMLVAIGSRSMVGFAILSTPSNTRT